MSNRQTHDVLKDTVIRSSLPMFDIRNDDKLTTPLELIGSKEYKSLAKSLKKYIKMRVRKIPAKDIKQFELMVLEYVRCKPYIKLFSVSIDEFKSFTKGLMDYGTVVYSKLSDIDNKYYVLFDRVFTPTTHTSVVPVTPTTHTTSVVPVTPTTHTSVVPVTPTTHTSVVRVPTWYDTVKTHSTVKMYASYTEILAVCKVLLHYNTYQFSKIGLNREISSAFMEWHNKLYPIQCNNITITGQYAMWLTQQSFTNEPKIINMILYKNEDSKIKSGVSLIELPKNVIVQFSDTSDSFNDYIYINGVRVHTIDSIMKRADLITATVMYHNGTITDKQLIKYIPKSVNVTKTEFINSFYASLKGSIGVTLDMSFMLNKIKYSDPFNQESQGKGVRNKRKNK